MFPRSSSAGLGPAAMSRSPMILLQSSCPLAASPEQLPDARDPTGATSRGTSAPPARAVAGIDAGSGGDHDRSTRHPGGAQPQARAHPAGRRAGRGYDGPAAGLGGAVLPHLLHPGRRRPGQAGPGRRGTARPRLGEAELLTVEVPGGATAERAARRYPASPARQLHERRPVRLGRDERMARGRRAGLHARARPAHPGGHPGQLPARPGGDRRRDRRRIPQPAHPVRDRPAAAVLPAAHRHQDGPAAAVSQPEPLPIQGDGQVLVG